MFDASSTVTIPRANERFFDNYRYYDELIQLRQKWTFLQAALTTIYFPAKKDIALDQILTFVEYRHVSEARERRACWKCFSLARIVLWKTIGSICRTTVNTKVC